MFWQSCVHCLLHVSKVVLEGFDWFAKTPGSWLTLSMLTGESAMTHPLLQSTHCSKIGKLVSHWNPFYSNVCLASPIAGSWFCPTQFSAYEQPWLGRFPQIVPTNDQILKFRSGIYTHCACSWTGKPLHTFTQPGPAHLSLQVCEHVSFFIWPLFIQEGPIET